MQSFLIPDVKQFMGRLLTSDAFDAFEVTTATLTAACTWSVDGQIHPDYYDTAPDASYLTWAVLRPHFLGLIRGKTPPLSLRITFRSPRLRAEELLRRSGSPMQETDLNGLYLHVRYDRKQLCLVTGVSVGLFTLDKRLEHSWDDAVKAFLNKQEIAFDY